MEPIKHKPIQQTNSLVVEVDQLRTEVAKLRAAIREHRDERRRQVMDSLAIHGSAQLPEADRRLWEHLD